MRRTQTSLRVWLLVALTVPALVAPQGVSSQAGTRAGVSTQRSSSGEDVQSSEARGTRGTRETDARGSRLGADEYAEVEDQDRRNLTDDPDPDSVEEHVQGEHGEAQEEEGAEPKDLPGAQQGSSSVTPQAISLPNAEGSIEGMGESFSPVLSSGTATFSVPIALPAGRAGVQPSLGLSYSSSNGNGTLGVGWGMGAPFIARQTDRGLPHYNNGDGPWHPREDRFIYNGGQELVPVDSAAMAIVDASGFYDVDDTAAVPPDVIGWQQYRARVEGGFMRFFRSPDSRRWVVQGKDGTRFDFGELPVMEGPHDLNSKLSLQSELGNGAGRIFAWHLTRMADSHGSTVYYRYREDHGTNYLEDIHYISPNSCARGGDPDAQRLCRAPLSDYGARVAIAYDEGRPDVFSNYTTGWRTETRWRVRMVTITVAEEEVGVRYLVRRYHLAYDGRVHHSLLASVQVEGRPDVQMPNAPEGVRVNTMVLESDLDPQGARVGRLLPPMTFEYSQMPTGNIAGFGGIDNAVHNVEFGPDVSVDLADADLFDVNTDGLPDLIVTEPARYRTADDAPAAGVFFNGFVGADTQPAGRAGVFSAPVAVPMRGDLGGIMRLRNANIVPMDVDGDGRNDLLHMPRLDSYGYFTPTRRADEEVDFSVRPAQQGWAFTYAEVSLDNLGDDPLIDLVRDGTHYKMWDVNNDHLVDVVRTTGTTMQTWMNLGWLPGGEGRFGQAVFNTDTQAWVLSTEPIETCLLHDGNAVDFSDREVRLADMNGDGIQDIVRIRRGRLVYWAGRGDALWGDGPATCGDDEGANRERHMASAPPELNPELSGVFLADLNADGLSDVIQVRFNQLDVWFNVNGERFTQRQIVASPFAPDFSPNVRFADINGSGTTDLVYGRAEQWKYMDLLGGVRPRLLTRVHNGLGATTTLSYASAAEDYTRDLQAADLCESDCGGDEFQWSQVGPPRGRTLADPGPNGAECPWGDRLLYQLSGECVYRSGGSPVLSTVVRAVATSDNFHLVGREENVMRSEFSYHEGYYEGIEQEFRGFGAADAVAVGDDHHGTQHTRTFFHQGRRPSHLATERLAENPYEALKGRQWYTETFDDAGKYLATAHGTVVARNLVTGLDGRLVWYAYVSQTDEFRYHHAEFVFAREERELPWLALQTVNSEGRSTDGEPPYTWGVPLRSHIFAHIRATTDIVDNVGAVRQQTALGRIQDEHDSGPQPEAVYEDTSVSHSAAVLLPGGRWLWRTEETYVTGDHDEGMRLGHTSNRYSALTGDLAYSVARAEVPANFPNFDFGGDATAQAYTLPRVQLIESSTAYDEWGSPVASCASGDIHNEALVNCLHYGEVEFDGAYGQLAVAERIAVHQDKRAGYCATTLAPFCMIETTASWDRGFGELRVAIDANLQTSQVGYDGLARLTQVTLPRFDDCSAMPDVPVHTFQYQLADSNGVPVNRVTKRENHGGEECSVPATIETVTYVDGLGRARASLARRDNDEWERSSVTVFNARGTLRLGFHNDLLSQAATGVAVVFGRPTTAYTEAHYDAFGRVVRAFAEDRTETATRYGATSTTVCDALDLNRRSRFFGTCTTTRVDGQGRSIDQVLRQRRESQNDANESYRLATFYRADGAVRYVARAETTDDTPISLGPTPVANHTLLRFFANDSLGRRIASNDPDSDSRALGTTQANSSWRYLFNDVGDLAAVRDPRGCGQNFYYDHAGRLIAEDYVTCSEAMPTGDLPDTALPADAIGMSVVQSGVQLVDARYFFDEAPDFEAEITELSTEPHWVGRMSGSTDRVQRSVVVYDARGQAEATVRQMAIMPRSRGLRATLRQNLDETGIQTTPPPRPQRFDEEHDYVVRTRYDYLGRVVAMEYPEDPDWAAMGGEGPGPRVGGALHYNRLGLPSGVALRVAEDGTDSSLYEVPVVRAIRYDANRLPRRVDYGDDSVIGSLFTEMTYDERLRPTRSRAVRRADPTAPGDRPLNAVTTIHDFRYTWDAANNLVEVADFRVAAEWPVGYRPWRQTVSHDALYRVNRIDFAYMNDGGEFGDDGDAPTNWRGERTRLNIDGSTHGQRDPMRQRPAPMVSQNGTSRVNQLLYDYDWLANQTDWIDDQGVFYERAAGLQVSGNDDIGFTGENPDTRPSALYLSTTIRSAPATATTDDLGGYVSLEYGDGGNVVRMTVHGQCRDRNPTTNNPDRTCADPLGSSIAARQARLDSRCLCQVEQHFRYDWDELNRLSEARRYDRQGGAGRWELMVQQRYRYNASNVRMIKETINVGADGDAFAATALSPYPGDYERRGLELDFQGRTYHASTTLGTETQYMVGGACLVWGTHERGSPALNREQRLTLPLNDMVQSTAAVVDLRSGALVEHTTFYPNGARETHRTTDNVSLQLEPVGFTAKEADEEVGLVYFGERYLLARLGRWASVDPLSVHQMGGGEAMNGYHYISGHVLQARDPIGLNEAATHITEVANLPSIAANGLLPNVGDKGGFWLGHGVYANGAGTPFATFRPGIPKYEGAAVLGISIDTDGFRQVTMNEWRRVSNASTTQANENWRTDEAAVRARYQRAMGGSASARDIRTWESQRLIRDHWDRELAGTPGAYMDVPDGENTPGGRLFVVRDTARISSRIQVLGRVVTRHVGGAVTRAVSTISRDVRGWAFSAVRRTGAGALSLTIANEFIPGFAEARFFVQHGVLDLMRARIISRPPPVVAPVPSGSFFTPILIILPLCPDGSVNLGGCGLTAMR